MGSFLLIVVAAIILSGIVFGAAAFTLGRDRGLTPPRPDGVPFDLPADRPLDRPDFEDIRFDTAIRGYRMDQVDDILHRVADDFDFLHARIIDLEDQLAGHRPEDEDEEPPFEFPWTDEKRAEATADPAHASDPAPLRATEPSTAAASAPPATEPEAGLAEPGTTADTAAEPGAPGPTELGATTAGGADPGKSRAAGTGATGNGVADPGTPKRGTTTSASFGGAGSPTPDAETGPAAGPERGDAAGEIGGVSDVAEIAAPPSGRGR